MTKFIHRLLTVALVAVFACGQTFAAYTEITVQSPGTGGTDLDETAGVSGGTGTGLKFQNDGQTYIQIIEVSAGTPNVIVESNGTFRGVALTANNQTIATTANGIKIAGPFDPELFNDSNGFVRLNFTGGGETGATVAAFRK